MADAALAATAGGSSVSRPAADPALAPIPGGLLPVTVRDLAVVRQNRRLIDGISLTIPPGTPTVIMGPNGAGKSLLLRVLHGLIAPDGGTVTWGDGQSTDVAGRRSALVFQRPTLLRRTVLDNVVFVLRHRPRASQRQTAQGVLDDAGLGHLAQVPARQLSGGEQQRLAMARALAGLPEVLFLDEPSSSLDPAATAAVEGMIAKAVANGTKVVMVTHDIGQARRIAGDIVFLDRGRIAECSLAPQFFSAASSKAAAAYLAGEIWIGPDGG